MNNTALGAENKRNRQSSLSAKHMKNSTMKNQKRYAIRMCTTRHFAIALASVVDTRRNINSIYDFKTGCVKTECLHEGWQTSGSMKVVRMAFNLYCNGTPSVDDYTKTEEQTNITELMLNDFIEKVVIHEAEGGRTKDRTQQVDIYFNFIGNFVLPLSEDEVEALQSEEARRAEEIAERKRKSSKKSTQKRIQKRAEIKAKAEAGDPEAMAEYKAILEKGRQNNRKRSEKMRELRMSDPEYRAKMEEKERLALEREKKRQERATKKKKIALAELKEQAEKGNQEAVRELEESRAIARERSRKSAEKRKQRAENDPEYAKYLEERNAEYNRRHTARRKEQMEALRARAEAGDQEAKSQLAERKQYQVRATVKSYRKMCEDALNGDPIAKERYEKTLAMRREAYHAKKSEQTA